jgi:uncharacterized membrane protein YhaH (DUF805 family)
MFKQPFSFDGRIRRTELCLSYLIYGFVVGILSAMAAGSPVFLILYIPAIWFLWAQNAKRCHDRGNSGWWQLIPFYSLWLMFADGMPGINEYGPNPKEAASNYNGGNNYGNNNYNNYNNNNNNGGYQQNNEYNGGYNGGHNAGGQNSGYNSGNNAGGNRSYDSGQNIPPQQSNPNQGGSFKIDLSKAPMKEGGEYNNGDLYK